MFSIIINEIKAFLRDRSNLFFFLIFPLVLVFLLGNLLETIDRDEAIGKIHAHYIIETQNPQNVDAIKSFISGLDEKEILSFESTDNIAASKEKVRNNEIAALIIFKEPFEIQIFGGSNRLQIKTLNTIMNGFTQTSKAISSVIKLAPMTLENDISIDNELVVQKDLGVKRSMLDYYAVAMLAMITLMSTLSGALMLSHERQGKTINRLIIAPQNRCLLYLQKILGTVPQVIIQISIVMFFSITVFDAHYAATLKSNIFLFAMFFIVTLAFISIGALIGLTVKANPMATVIPVIWIMLFLGRSFSKEIYIEAITPYMPSYILQNAAFDITIFGRYNQGLRMMLISVIIFIVSLTAGAFIFNRMEEER